MNFTGVFFKSSKNNIYSKVNLKKKSKNQGPKVNRQIDFGHFFCPFLKSGFENGRKNRKIFHPYHNALFLFFLLKTLLLKKNLFFEENNLGIFYVSFIWNKMKQKS
jgi:hypothetical protein